MSITVTENAAKRVTSFLANRGKGVGVRLGVRTSGCSGMAYVLEFADEVGDEDVVFEDRGVKVIIDPKSLVYLDGTELDFGKEGLNEGFKFNNPNVKNTCGCGESFNIRTATVPTPQRRRHAGVRLCEGRIDQPERPEAKNDAHEEWVFRVTRLAAAGAAEPASFSVPGRLRG